MALGVISVVAANPAPRWCELTRESLDELRAVTLA
jgi:hypothetical protein